MFYHLEIDDSSGIGYWHPYLGLVQVVLLPPVNFLSLGLSVLLLLQWSICTHEERTFGFH